MNVWFWQVKGKGNYISGQIMNNSLLRITQTYTPSAGFALNCHGDQVHTHRNNIYSTDESDQSYITLQRVFVLLLKAINTDNELFKYSI